MASGCCRNTVVSQQFFMLGWSLDRSTPRRQFTTSCWLTSAPYRWLPTGRPRIERDLLLDDLLVDTEVIAAVLERLRDQAEHDRSRILGELLRLGPIYQLLAVLTTEVRSGATRTRMILK